MFSYVIFSLYSWMAMDIIFVTPVSLPVLLAKGLIFFANSLLLAFVIWMGLLPPMALQGGGQDTDLNQPVIVHSRGLTDWFRWAWALSLPNHSKSQDFLQSYWKRGSLLSLCWTWIEWIGGQGCCSHFDTSRNKLFWEWKQYWRENKQEKDRWKQTPTDGNRAEFSHEFRKTTTTTTKLLLVSLCWVFCNLQQNHL